MADNFDWNQFDEAPQAAAPSGEFNWDQLPEVPKDKATGVDAPTYADGSSPEAPINKSPVSVSDRLALSTGNAQGSLKFLKSKYEDAQVDKHGKIVIKDKGQWHRVDPTNLGDGDPWERTQELVKDLADAVPSMWKGGSTAAAAALVGGQLGPQALLPEELVTVPLAFAGGAAAGLAAETMSDEISGFIKDHAQSVGAGAAGLAGAGIAASGVKAIAKGGAPAAGVALVNELGRTSLGRLVGTYDATPEEQLKDIGLETLLTFGSAAPAAGVKPTAQFLGDSLKSVGKAVADSGEGFKNLVATAIGGVADMQPGNIKNFLDRGVPVSNEFKRVAMKSGNSADMFQNFTSDAIKDVKKVATQAQPALSKLWGDTEKKILNEVPSHFESNADDLVLDAYLKAADSKLGEFVKTTQPKQTKLASLFNEAPDAPKKSIVDPAEIRVNLASGKRGLPEGVEFKMRPHEAIVNEGKVTGKPIPEALDPDSYNFIKDFIGGLKPFEDMKRLSGANGAKQLLTLKKYLGSSTYKITEQAKDEALPGTAMAIKDMEQILDKRLMNKFSRPNGTNPYEELNALYSDAKDEIQNIIRTVQVAKKNQTNEPYEQLFKQISSKSGSNVVRKEGFERAVEIIKQSGSPDISTTVQGLKDRLSAREFTPWVKSGLQRASLGAAFGGLVSGNVPLAVGATSTAAALSPRVMKSVLGTGMAAKNVSASLVNHSFEALDFLKRLPPQQMKTLIKQPQMLQSLFQSVNQSSGMEKQMTDNLVNGALMTSEPAPLPPLPVDEKGK